MTTVIKCGYNGKHYKGYGPLISELINTGTHKPQLVVYYDHLNKEQRISYRLLEIDGDSWIECTKYQLLKHLNENQNTMMHTFELVKRLRHGKVQFNKRLDNQRELKQLVREDVNVKTMHDIFTLKQSSKQD